MSRTLLATVLLSSLMAFSGQASAITISTGGVDDAFGNQTSAVSGAIVETFDGQSTFVQPWAWSATGSLHVVNGNASGQYAAPFGDTTNYYSADPAAGVATVAFGGVYNYIGLLWGSVDDYNSIDLYLGNALVMSVLGTDAIAAANGDQGPQGTTYFNISDVSFDTAMFRSTSYAFEFDNLAVASVADVPEPATLGLFGIALAGMGALRRRRLPA